MCMLITYVFFNSIHKCFVILIIANFQKKTEFQFSCIINLFSSSSGCSDRRPSSDPPNYEETVGIVNILPGVSNPIVEPSIFLFLVFV